MNRSRRLRVGALLITLAVLGACGGDDDEATDTTDARSTTTKRAVTTTTGVPVIAPLTGLNDPSGTSGGRGPLAVKIDNVPYSSGSPRPPQAGIESADVVYEEPVEGTTRFLAIFHSTLPTRIGPVRSTRFLDPGIVWHLGGLYVYSGGTPDKVAAIRAAPVQTVDENGLQQANARERDPNFRAPHNLFLKPEALWQWDQVTDRTPPAPLFGFLAEGEDFPGAFASVVAIPTATKSTYTWDAANGNWKREALIRAREPVQAHVAESGDQIAPTNLIVQRISGVNDKSVLVGEGQAWVCSQGKCTAATWRRTDLDAPTVFIDPNGDEILLTPGTTWVHLLTSGEPTFTP